MKAGGTDNPVATKTALGWTVHGPTCKAVTAERVLFHATKDDDAEDELHLLVKDSFSTESFGVKVCEAQEVNVEDDRAMMLLRTTTKRIGERFETGLLWKNDGFSYPESKRDAMRRLWIMEKKMDRDAKLAAMCCEKIEDYLKKGYARKLSRAEAAVVKPRTRYIPIFPVFNPNKPGKVRLVFDCKSKSNGVSFNDGLLKGPDFLKPIPAILWRFRRGKIGFCGDIREMYHQVMIREEDQDSQRFLWRGMSRDRPAETYVMSAMIFGAACSPASALYAKDLNAEEFKSEFPEAVQAIQENTYMDDTLDSCDTVEDATKRISDIIEVNKRGGFSIVNWICSSREVSSMIPAELRAKDWKDLEALTQLPVERVLGMWWNAEKDEFTFKTKFHKVKDAVLKGLQMPTKREVLSLMMSLFDPVGFLAHFVIKGRIIFQDIWKVGIGWDEKIPHEFEKSWRKWLAELQLVPTVAIPRCYTPKLNEATDVQLHVFNDASKEAFACVAYLRVQHSSGVDVAFVAGKVRVKPLKELTIPRMELQAAVLGCRLAKTIQEEIQVKINSTVFWSDSQTVICWVKSEKKLPKWEAARVAELLSVSSPEDWRWVPTDVNPADAATRKDKPTDFSASGIWFHGPEFLREEAQCWPILGQPCSLPLEHGSDVALLLTEEELEIWALPDVRRFGSWIKLIRTTAWILRYVHNFVCKYLKKRDFEKYCKPKTGELTVAELKKAERLWVKKSQSEQMMNERKILSDTKENKHVTLPKSSKLFKMNVFLDDENIIRLKGRTALSNDVQDDAKFPFILSAGCGYVELLLQHFHEMMGHQGVETVIHLAQQSYWIMGIRNAVKKIVRSCQRCSNVRAQPCEPEMGLLPEARVSKGIRPFLNVGMDLFGPLYVKVGRKVEKRYGTIFACMSTRAIHIEMVDSLTTDSALNAIRRFTARRGYPVAIYCDNGSNLRGCERELRELASRLDDDEIQRKLTTFDIEFHFSPAATPHWGGSWERLIRTVKTALSAVLKERFPKSETLHTFLTEVEYMINARPLTHVSIDPNDLEPLTPLHFLLAGDRRVPSWTDPKPDLRKQYQIAQMITDSFWRRWTKEYLPTLNLRPKWNTTAKQVVVGDVVLMVDPNGPRNSWPLGIIERVFPGRDGVVRAADVRNNEGIYRRGVRQLVVLDVKK